MAPRVSPTQRIRDEIAELIAGAATGSLLDHFEQVARLAVRLVMQSALEAEVTESWAATATPVVSGSTPAPATATRPCRSRPPLGR